RRGTARECRTRSRVPSRALSPRPGTRRRRRARRPPACETPPAAPRRRPRRSARNRRGTERRAPSTDFRLLPLADIDEVAGDGGGGGHLRAHQVGAALEALAALEIAVRGR